ncbi:MAG: DegT/DnrJ/EryC1/StrS family aminotransferase [Candidatus Saganbacteria bacterium]|nr:DegT/DnrJ/EryC1/StrS family aminotransferase [Candidatus Saganbacteria bacterium]
MPIPILDLKAEYRSIKSEIDTAVAQVLESGHFVLGPNVAALEKEIASYCGTKYGVAVASGTDALFLSLKALGIKEGDEVIIPTLTFFATAEAVSYTGARPVFADADPETHNIDVEKIKSSITKNTKAIMPVHLWGLPAEMEKIMGIAKENGLFVVEDCAQSIGSEYNDKKTGSFGNTGCFSFFPTKNLGAYGDAGMIVTDDEKIFEKLKLLHLHGSKARGVHEMIGYNSRLDELQAAVLRIKLKYIDIWNGKRRTNAKYYTSRFSQAGIKCPAEPEGFKHVYHQYTIEVDDREKVLKNLTEQGVSAFIYYPNPAHLQAPYRELGYGAGDFPAAEKIGTRMLSIPVHPFLSTEDVKAVADAVVEAVK